MKKIFLLALLLLSLTLPAAAAKQEWRDKNFDFAKTQFVEVAFNVDASLENGIVEKRTAQYVEEDLIQPLAKKLKKLKISWAENTPAAAPEGQRLYLNIYLENYSVGTSYREGYSYSTREPVDEEIMTPAGPIIVHKTQIVQHYQPGGNVPTIYVSVRFDVEDEVSGEAVWSRTDDRSRQNAAQLDNSQPADVFKRIIKDFAGDFVKQLK